MTRPAETPAEMGYFWPAEWEPHAATWVAWPHNRETWPGKFDVIPEQFAALVQLLARVEPVHVLAGGSAVMSDARSYLGDARNVTLWDIPTNDAWCRDHGPTFLVNDKAPTVLIDWDYNAWGAKYPPYDLDNAVPMEIASRRGLRRFTPGIVLEGGAIETNGRGTLLTTPTCLLNPNRNPALDLETLERTLRDYLGVSKILWLPRGDLAGDDTDGHVDQLARFVNPTTVVAAVSDDRTDANFEPLQENWRQLQTMSDQNSETLEVLPLELPRAKYFGDQRLPASYLNFYIANNLVIVPQFDDPADDQALRLLESLFPDRQVHGLPAWDIVWGLGAFHCLTQQEPQSQSRINEKWRG
jgi:agmatine deiminase